jgi:ATP-binding cassette subfamily B protein
MIVLTIALLFVQANADLALPDYMSRIVNIGIQQGGVESPIPSAIRQSELERVGLFMSAADYERVKANYTLLEPGAAGYADAVAKYPLAESEPVVLLNTISAEEETWMKPVMARALLAVSGIEQALADPAKAAEMGAKSGFDLSRLPKGTDVFAMLAKMPAAQRDQMREGMNEQFAALGDSMLEQAGMRVVRGEYEALGVNTDQLEINYILGAGGLMLLITLLSVVCAIAVGYLSARAAAGAARDIRKAVFEKVESFSSTEFDHFSTASLITRTTNDVTQIQMVIIMMMRMVFYAPIIAVGGIIRAIGKDSSMWWLIAVAVAMLLSLIGIVISLSLPKFKIMQNLVDRLNLVVRDSLAGMMVIRAFNMQPFETERFDKANQDLTGTTLFVSRVMATMFPSMMFIMSALTIAILWVGSHQVAEARMQVGDMMAFLQYAMQIVFSFLMMSFMFIILPRASVSAGRIAEVLEAKLSILDPAEPRKFSAPFTGKVEFRDVSFRYPGAEEDVLRDISFTAQPGQTTALIGSTGSGKSTVVNLIPRFYDITAGSILIDGTDIRAVSQHDLRERIGYIPQKSMLFSGTIESNLRYADEQAGDDVIAQAVEDSQAAEFINSTPEGLRAEISQGGANVSGGQKQRLSIARALVKRTPIYIFDDSFSALDFKTDAALRRALRTRLKQGSTLFIVTQRVSTIRNAEQILVLDDGKLVGKGTHAELMADCETYREIALSQLSAEELS